MKAIGRQQVELYTLFRFKDLETFTRDEVAIWNWRQRFLRRPADWRTWIQEAWQELLHVPAGFEISISYKHTADPQQEPARRAFKQREIFIGRESDNDIALPTLTVGKRHARIFVENGQCFLEDLGSSLGSYLNQTRLAPNQPHPINAGDQIAIFPYTFSLTVRQLWAPELNVGIHSAGSESMTWREFLNLAPKGRTTFPIEAHPLHAVLCLEVNRAFLADLAEGLLRPLDLSRAPSGLTPADSGIFEFLIVCLLERVNRDLAFPFQFDTGACGVKPAMGLETRGIVMTCSVSLLAMTGALRLFVPYSLLRRMQDATPQPKFVGLPPSLAWNFPVSWGFQPLTVEELRSLERDDVLLFRTDPQLLNPGRMDSGWKVSAAGNEDTAAALSNIGRVRIDKYFEREVLPSGDFESSETKDRETTPDLGQLPLRVHVIVAEKELTLAEANGLAPGTILELNRPNSGQVLLAINGKTMGEGELVDVEGRLGVRIASWRGD